MKQIIENFEKERILEMHSKLHRKKQYLTEQQSSVKDRLLQLRDSGCISGNNLFIQEFEGYSKADYQYAIAQESSKTPGKFRYIFIDNKVGMFNPAGKWEWVGTWDCQTYIDKKKAEEKQRGADADKNRIDILKAERGAKTYEEWLKDGVDPIRNPTQFEEFVIGSTKLYARKQFGGVGAKSEKAKEILKNITDRGGKLENEVNDEQRKVWNREVIVQPGGVDFPDGLVAYFPPNSEVRGKISDKYQEVRTNTRLNDEELKNCEENIKQWYEDWSADIKYEPSTHNSTKQIVQACVNQLKINKLKRAFGKTDNYIDLLTGKAKPGPYSDDIYRLNPPRV